MVSAGPGIRTFLSCRLQCSQRKATPGISAKVGLTPWTLGGLMDIILTSILKGKMGRERKTRNQSYSYFLKTKTQSFCLAKGGISVIGAHDLLSRMPHNNVYIYVYIYIYIHMWGLMGQYFSTYMSQKKVPGPASPATDRSNKTSCLSPKHHRCSAGFLPP